MAQINDYKKTDVGTIPQEWEVDLVKNNACIDTGSKNTQDRNENGVYPFFVRSQTVERINTYSFEGEAVLTAGDGVGTGKVFHYIDGKFDYHQRVYKISDFGSKLYGYFFYLYFSNYFYNRIMQMTAKSSVDSVRMEMIANMKVPIPPISEQIAISSTIKDLSSLAASLEKLIDKKKNIKKGAMQKLLQPKEGWKMMSLGEIGKFSKGQGIKKDEAQSGTIPCVRYGELYTTHQDYIKKFTSFISPIIARKSQRIKYGDILFAGSGETKEEIGKCAALIDEVEAFAGGDIIILSPVNQSSLFLGYLLNSKFVQKQKANKGQGDAVVHISVKQLESIIIQIPALQEQNNIASILYDMDNEIFALESKLEKYKNIKQGMVQNLLTGRIRLV